MLESLCQGAGTIHDLNLAGAFPARAPYRPWELYAALKQTPLFDAERGQWNGTMSREQILKDSHCFPTVELVGMLVETQCNREGARALYENRKATLLYDDEGGQKNASMSEEQRPVRAMCIAHVQLLGVLVEAQFSPEKARARYEKLKATPLYDPEREQWNSTMSKGLMFGDTSRQADAQLIGVLVEAQCNREGARELYEQLKATPLYDPERGQWNDWMSEGQRLSSTERGAAAQLFGVLAEAQFNPEKARALYEQLTATPLYDPEQGQWNAWMSEAQILRGTDRHAVIQLLGVLVEATLRSTLSRRLAEAVPPLPITEEW